ncbi:MAG: hypothetical protein COB38_00135 [Gammaproteobacteria bacterium]|nr:MAG: hypothetical protein COB38_00135 [Gammaproteobacteria bacterium]
MAWYQVNLKRLTAICFLMLIVTHLAMSEEHTKTKVVIDNKVQPGIFDRSMKLSSGDTLRYTISIPENYNSAKPTPLILALHYGGKVTPHYSRKLVDILIEPGLKELNAIIIAPDSIAGYWGNKKNETAIFELMNETIKKYSIDIEKTLLTGFSMGGLVLR